MSDIYDDDSEGYEETLETSNNDEQQDDEQHAQKVNGKIDSLKMKVKELEADLKKEKKLHEKTKESLSVASNSSKEKSRKEESASAAVIQELMSTCSKLSVDLAGYKIEDSTGITEDDILSILRSIGEKKNAQAQTDGSSRPATNQSAKGGGKKSKGYASEDEMRKRIEDLEDELRLAMGAAEDIKALKAKLLMMIERIRSEKESRDKLNFELKATRKKLAILTDHIEKLMGHLKHEAAAKIRSLESLRDQEKITLHANQKCLKLVRKAAAKDRLILELREGGKILEDQLRLMDEKYLELRTKLDYARESSEKRIKKAERTAGDLRVKFALAGNMGSLDAIPLPQSQMMGQGTFDGTGSLGSFDQDGYTIGDGQSYYTADTKNSSKISKQKKPRSGSAPKAKTFENEEEKEIEVQRLMEKMRMKKGSSANWNEEKAKDLIGYKH